MGIRPPSDDSSMFEPDNDLDDPDAVDDEVAAQMDMEEDEAKVSHDPGLGEADDQGIGDDEAQEDVPDPPDEVPEPVQPAPLPTGTPAPSGDNQARGVWRSTHMRHKPQSYVPSMKGK